MPGDELWMRRALGWARLAARRGDVPIGAILVKDDELLAHGHDAREVLGDPTGHAEILCLREGARKIGGWRLDDCTLYVTLEPCPMCAGALVQARVKRLVYGASNARWGACREGVDPNILANPRFNHCVEVAGGVLEAECARVLKETFREYRKKEQ
ncbi:nucleoside deaminase [Candidatus Sumerlaeota bacterium]|nr:nucleoside deaminase [Candidatus Sumerlaeota bacterium]